MSKLRVLTGVIGKGRGGLSYYAVGLLKTLDPEKYEFTFLSNDPEPFFGEEIRTHGGRILAIPSRSRHPLAHRRALDRVFAEERFDICHIHLSSASNIEPLKAAERAGVPLVIAHSHNAGLSGNTLSRFLHRRNVPEIARCTHKRLACSELAGRFLYGDADFQVVKNAIDLDRFAFSQETRESVRREFSLEGKFTVGHVGRMTEAKNPRFLLELFREIHSREPESALLYIGSGEMEAELKAYARELGIAESIRFAGQVPDPERYLCAMDCFLLPSRFEGLGYAVIEAVCTGLRCFVSDVLPQEAIVGRLVETFPLDADKALLAERVLAVRGSAEPRTGQRALLETLGYDLASQVRTMEAIYDQAGCGPATNF
ncbi:MAG: glycosyltransferase [Candidatus Merdivicinus sp.]|jgi:glycosyltransferase involved in cell wall biosynthesis